MAVGDFLKDVLKQFAMTAPQNVGDALYSRMAPQAFQQEQENLRQKNQLAQQQQMQQAQLAQQLNLHNSITPYEQQQVQLQQQQHTDTLKQQQFENQRQQVADQLGLAGQVHAGALLPTQGGQPGAVKVGDQNFNYNPAPKPFTFVPTHEMRQSMPWMPAEGVQMPPSEFPQFLNNITTFMKNDPRMLGQLVPTLENHIKALVTDPTRQAAYLFELHDAALTGNRAKLLSVEEDARKFADQDAAETNRIAAQNSPTAIRGAAAKAGAEASARTNAEQASFARTNPEMAGVAQPNQKYTSDKAQTIGDEADKELQSVRTGLDLIKATRNGNKATSAQLDAQGNIILMGSQGFRRILNKPSNAGSAYDAIAGKIGKGLTGVGQTDSLLNDMEKEFDMEGQRIQQTYEQRVGNLNSTMHSTITPQPKYSPLGTPNPSAIDSLVQKYGGK